MSGPYWASQLSQKLGYPVAAGEPYYVPGCISSSQCVLPNAIIPKSAWSAPAQHLLQYILTPNVGVNQFATSAFNEDLRDDKGAFAWTRTPVGERSPRYYFAGRFHQNNPHPTAQGGAKSPDSMP